MTIRYFYVFHLQNLSSMAGWSGVAVVRRRVNGTGWLVNRRRKLTL
jgi:hypothetical protein